MKKKWHYLFFLVLSLNTSLKNYAQQVVTVDPDFCTVTGRLPFDVSFYFDIPEKCIEGKVGTLDDIRFAAFIPYSKKGDIPMEDILTNKTFRVIEDKDGKKTLRIFQKGLIPNKEYDIVIFTTPTDLYDIFIVMKSIYEARDTEQNLKYLIKNLSEKRRKRGDFTTFITKTGDGNLDVFKKAYIELKLDVLFPLGDEKLIRSKLNNYMKFNSSFLLTADTFFNNLITDKNFNFKADFGYVYYGFQKNIGGLMPYVGLQYELKPYNSDVLLRDIPDKNILRRLSISSGLSLGSIAKKGKRVDLTGNKSLLFGGNLRLTNAFRLSLGGIFFYREDKNPLIDNQKLVATPYAGLSIDGSLSSVLNDLGKIIPTLRR